MGISLSVIKISQQTAFTLDETGAKVESKGTGDVIFAEPVREELEMRRPKKLIFDKPFFVILKRKESSNPYLMLWIANAELMKY